MRYGIFGDIHSNLEAFEAVLEDMQNQHLDKLICVGDVVGYGADPSACIQKVKALGCPVVAGNHDFATVDKISVEFFNTFAREAALWTRRVISEEEKNFLSALKLVEYVDDLTIVHATLHYPELFEYIQTSYDAHLAFERLSTQLCFLGHSHIPVVFFKKRTVSFTMEPQVVIDLSARMIVNVGSVGQPRDENPDACYAILDTGRQDIQIRRVKYDVDTAARKIVQAGLPAVLAERLRYGR